MEKEIEKQVDKMYTDLVILSELLYKDGTISMNLNTWYADIAFKIKRDKKKDKLNSK